MHDPRALGTGRLRLTPVAWGDLDELARLKSDPLVYAQMLGGVRTPMQVADELADDTTFWARHRAGMWLVRPNTPPGTPTPPPAIGLVGLHQRTDGRGIAIRFAFTPESRGAGLAREAAGAALRYAHDRAHIHRIVAVARESNIGSRTVLGAIGMREYERFTRGNEPMVAYESLAAPTRQTSPLARR